jgi:DNA-cytosine methyltransferase
MDLDFDCDDEYMVEKKKITKKIRTLSKALTANETTKKTKKPITPKTLSKTLTRTSAGKASTPKDARGRRHTRRSMSTTSSSPSSSEVARAPRRRRLDDALRNAQPIKIGHDFCGIQAPLQALEEAGVPYDHVFSSDNNAHVKTIVMKSFRPNVFYDDVTTRDNSKAPYVDMLVFGPPCQPWSAAGLQKGIDDPKNRGVLLFASLGYIKAKRPACFVMEEVATVLTRHSKLYKSLKRMLEACDYVVCEQIMNTKLHGLPQSRRRLYMVGIRKDRMRVDASFTFPADLPGDALPLHKVLPRRVPLALQRSELTGHARRNFKAAKHAATKIGLNVDKEHARRRTAESRCRS